MISTPHPWNPTPRGHLSGSGNSAKDTTASVTDWSDYDRTHNSLSLSLPFKSSLKGKWSCKALLIFFLNFFSQICLLLILFFFLLLCGTRGSIIGLDLYYGSTWILWNLPEVFTTVNAGKTFTVSAKSHMLFYLYFLHWFTTCIACKKYHF